MTTNKLGKFALQSNGLAVLRNGKILRILLCNNKCAVIQCTTAEQASKIENTILWYEVTSQHAGYEFDFYFDIQIMEE